MNCNDTIRALVKVGVLAVAVSAAACDKSEGGGGDASAKTAGSSAPAGGATTSGASSKPKTTLKNADVKKAYEAAFNDQSKMTDPLDKKIEAFVAQIGKPESEAGGKKIWHAVEGDECHRFELTLSNGMGSNETVDKSECGL